MELEAIGGSGYARLNPLATVFWNIGILRRCERVTRFVLSGGTPNSGTVGVGIALCLGPELTDDNVGAGVSLFASALSAAGGKLQAELRLGIGIQATVEGGCDVVAWCPEQFVIAWASEGGGVGGQRLMWAGWWGTRAVRASGVLRLFQRR